MSNHLDDIRQLFVRYLEQQRELYGSEFSLPREQVQLLEESLIGHQSATTTTTPGKTDRQGSANQPARLEEFYHQIKDCQNCPLGRTRNKFVFGVGNPNAEAMLIGEAPGADEDRIGEPFVGQAGQLLTKMLAAIKFKREEVFIANILKCRPPNNRDPLPSEVDECEPYLHEQIEIIDPSVILALGRVSAQTLLKTKKSLTELRGKLNAYQSIPMVVTFHPAALLRTSKWKYPAWDDLRYFRSIYDAIQKGDNPESVIFKHNTKSE